MSTPNLHIMLMALTQESSESKGNLNLSPDCLGDCVLGSFCQNEFCKNPGRTPHLCPYKEDVDGDSESKCTCCRSCTEGCAWSI